MKTLNISATAILNKIMGLMDDGYVRIDNADGWFMSVSAEVISDNIKFKIISIAHYYEQEGDLMADPEMCFIFFKNLQVYAPCYFKQNGCINIEQDSIVIEDGEIKGIRMKMQSDHTGFANMWLKNIKYQQNL